jgi:hypothetical protein
MAARATSSARSAPSKLTGTEMANRMALALKEIKPLLTRGISGYCC